MKGRGFRVVFFTLLTLGAATALYLWLRHAEPVSVTVVVVQRGVVEDTVANTRAGTIKACRRAGISPRTGGQIDRLPVKEGDKVAQGEILMTFWNDDLNAQVRLAESEYESSGAKAEQVCILAQVAEREARRLRQLKRQQLAAEEAVDKADGDASAQRAACAAARSAVNVSKSRLDVALAALEQTRLKAPFAGIVAEVNGEVGEFVTPSPVGIPTPPAVDLMDISCVYASAPIDEVDAPGIAIGMPVRIALDAFPERRFDGRIRRIAPYVLDREKQARTVDVEVDFDIPEACDCLLPGYSADIEIILKARAEVLRIPTESLREGNKVYLLTADNLLSSRAITPGLSNWAWTEVDDGLQAGDRVVTSIDREGVVDGAAAKAEESGRDD
ncbi:MAG: efflux RND transporter periplasmic adaptor subunit [Gammaproteobacteria bacterium]|nr:efflux RND transporter periplasmic adaptor subunit [Gammaproteobacteria bacterium]